MKRIVSTFLLVFIMSTSFSGCFDRREVDDLTYVIAVGLDKGKVNALKLTVQYAIPSAIAGGGGGGGGGEGGSKAVANATIEAPSIFSGLNMLNNFIGKQLNLSHAQVAVFSKEIAKSGKMHDYLHAMVRTREFRPNMHIAVSRDSAEEYIKSIKPIQELNPAKYYELKYSTYKYTGFTANTTLGNFYNNSETISIQPVATLVGVSSYNSSKDIDPSNSTFREKGRDKPSMGDYKAGEIPKAGDVEGETLGLAVFDGGRFVGELDGEEATMHLIASGEYISSYMTFPDPKEKGSYVVLNVKQSRKPQYKVNFENGKPQINLKVRLEGDYLSIQSGKNYESGEELKVFEDSAEQYLKTELLRFLNRTSKELHSDICGFGKYARSKFLTWNELVNFNWLGRYKDSTFNIDIDMKVRRPGLMIRSLPAKSSNGEEQ